MRKVELWTNFWKTSQLLLAQLSTLTVINNNLIKTYVTDKERTLASLVAFMTIFVNGTNNSKIFDTYLNDLERDPYHPSKDDHCPLLDDYIDDITESSD